MSIEMSNSSADTQPRSVMTRLTEGGPMGLAPIAVGAALFFAGFVGYGTGALSAYLLGAAIAAIGVLNQLSRPAWGDMALLGLGVVAVLMPFVLGFAGGLPLLAHLVVGLAAAAIGGMAVLRKRRAA